MLQVSQFTEGIWKHLQIKATRQVNKLEVREVIPKRLWKHMQFFTVGQADMLQVHQVPKRIRKPFQRVQT